MGDFCIILRRNIDRQIFRKRAEKRVNKHFFPPK